MSTKTLDNNKRIAKNTLLLYVRLIFMMAVGLFTSRVVLNTLGVEDYGTYNVVGGVVAMFSLFTSSLSAAISRYLTYELGKGNVKKLNVVFTTSITIQVTLALGVSLLAEIGGVWFLNSHMNIPYDRMNAANWVLQFSILTFAINLLSSPYNAAIIAHEKMSAFAYISILEVVLKLLVAYALYVSPIDKLKTYAFLLAMVALIICIVYAFYCRRNFAECHYRFIFDKSLLKNMSSFAGWNLLGSGAYLFNTQGVNIVTNLYFGVAINAARGVAGQAEGIIRQFVTNFTTAINPQITKSYAAGDMHYIYSLVCRGAKFSYFLMFFCAVPFMFETETIMRLWLKNYPPEAPLFLRLSMIGTLFDILGNATANAAWATGNVKKYYIIVGGVGCLVFPLSWLAFVLGMEAYASYIAFAVIYLLLVFLKLYIIKGLINFPVVEFYRSVFGRIIPVSVLSFIIPSFVYFNMDESLFRTFIVLAVSCISTSLIILEIGMSKSERNRVVLLVKNKLFNKLK